MKQPNPSSRWREDLRSKAEALADNLRDYNGIGECKICGADPVKQAEWVIKLVEEQLYNLIEEVRREVKEVKGIDKTEEDGTITNMIGREQILSKLNELEKKYVNGLEKK